MMKKEKSCGMQNVVGVIKCTCVVEKESIYIQSADLGYYYKRSQLDNCITKTRLYN